MITNVVEWEWEGLSRHIQTGMRFLLENLSFMNKDYSWHNIKYIINQEFW